MTTPARIYVFADNSMVASYRNKILGERLDPQGGALEMFSIRCEPPGGGGPVWAGAGFLPMEDGHRPALNPPWQNWIVPSIEDWLFGDVNPGIDEGGLLVLCDAAPGQPLRCNTGAPNTNLAIYGEWEETLIGPASDPLAQWAAALADVTRKPNALEEQA